MQGRAHQWAEPACEYVRRNHTQDIVEERVWALYEQGPGVARLKSMRYSTVIFGGLGRTTHDSIDYWQAARTAAIPTPFATGGGRS